MGIIKFITKRILQVIPLLVIVSIMSFFIIRLAPIDPLAELRLNPSISEETLQKEIKRLRLDKPVGVQYLYWAKSFVRIDLGYTSDGEKVSVKLKERIPNTLLLTLVVIFMTWVTGIPLGILAAIKKETAVDRLLTVLSSVGMAIIITRCCQPIYLKQSSYLFYLVLYFSYRLRLISNTTWVFT